MKFLKTGLVVAAAIFVAACSDSPRVQTPIPPDVPSDPPPSFSLQAVHASSNAPSVNINVNGSLAYGDVDYKESPTPVSLSPGTYSLAVDAILPDGSVLADVLTAADVPFEGNNVYTVFAIGNVGDEGDTALQAKVVARPTTVVPSGTVRVRALHAAAGAPPVNVYVTAPGTDLSTVDPINGDTPVAFGDDPLGPLDIDEGEWQIRITAAEIAGEPVVFDTGTVVLEGGTDPIVAAVDNTFAGSNSPVSALLVTRLGVAEVFDVNSTAEVRVTHAVPDVGAPVEVWVDGAAAITDFNFTETEGPLPLPEGSYVFQVAVGGTPVINAPTTDDDGNEVPPASTTLDAGVYYDVAAVGSVAADNLGLTAFADNRRRLATAAKLRLAHLSPSTPDVDIYLVDEAVTDISAIDPSFSDIPYLFNSGYLQVDPGTYNVYITPAGTKDIAISALAVPLPAASLNTAFARDADTGETGPGLILLDDLSP